MTERSKWTLSQILPSQEGAIDELLMKTMGELESRGCDERDLYTVRLALEEAFNNAREHGNRRDSSKLITVDCCVDGDRFWASVTDEGQGFDPQDVPDCRKEENLLKPRGRGLFLMRMYMDKIRYNGAGNSVFLEKLLSRAGKRESSSEGL